MPLNTIPLPYGLRDVRITPYTDGAATTLGTAIDFPYGQMFTFTAKEDFEELRGDDHLVAVHGKGEQVEWELEGGGLPLEACAAMMGGTVVTSGVTPNQVKTWGKKYTDMRPYFKIEGQAISDSGGDVHGIVYKCKATGELKGEMKDGAFWTSASKGTGLPATLVVKLDYLYEFVQNETATAIPA